MALKANQGVSSSITAVFSRLRNRDEKFLGRLNYNKYMRHI
jgi:hypothetical protein